MEIPKVYLENEDSKKFFLDHWEDLTKDYVPTEMDIQFCDELLVYASKCSNQFYENELAETTNKRAFCQAVLDTMLYTKQDNSRKISNTFFTILYDFLAKRFSNRLACPNAFEYMVDLIVTIESNLIQLSQPKQTKSKNTIQEDNMKKKEYYALDDILNWMDIDYEFEQSKSYPFTRGKENVKFGWGQILIPKYGIRQTIQNKVSDIKEIPIKEIKMMYQLPFMVTGTRGPGCGIINQNISLSFRYDKEWKYGDVTKSIYEVCFAILECAKETNDFYIIDEDYLFNFMSNFVINNQYGLGALEVVSGPEQYYGGDKEEQEEYDEEEICSDNSSSVQDTDK